MNALKEYLWHVKGIDEAQIEKILELAEQVYSKKKEGMDLSDLDQEALAEQVRKGCTSGVLDSEDFFGDNIRISWELATNKFYTNKND